MLKKGSKLYSILTGSCPNCHNESMFISKNPYKLNQLFDMHKTCSHCGTTYQIEPSFFYGAMYVSYAMGVALGIIVFLITKFIFDTSLKTSFLAILSTLIILLPVLIRYSRNIWINIFINFKENKFVNKID